MTIGGAMNTAVSALQAQSQQLAMISGNLANSSTTGYKTTTASFATLLSGENSQTYSGSGVVAYSTQSLTAQGSITASTVSTNVAIDGQGMFPVTYNEDKSELYFTRDGEFAADSDGNLVNNGYYLMGWPTDTSGNVQSADTTSVNGLETINVNRYSFAAEASTTETLKANIPADAASGAVLSTSVSIFDSLGTAQTVPVTWTKSVTANEWTMTLSNPVNATSGTQTGTIGGNTSYTVTFGGDGSLSSIKDSGGVAVTSPTITVSSWKDGASASAVTMDLSSVTQLASGSTTPAITIKSATADGYAYGQLTGVTIGTDGMVTANYDNGQTMSIYKIPVATFANENGLLSMSNNVYQVTGASGSYSLQEAGTAGAGKIDGSSLESSTVDTSSQFSLMIVAQQAYSAASQVISASKEMYDDLIQVVR